MALHLSVGTALLIDLPAEPPVPEPEESVSVDLIPPPEEEPEQAEEPPKEEPKQEEAKAEPPPPEEKAEEAPKPEEPPPEEKQAEEQAGPPPPPPPPPPPAPQEKPPEEKAEAQQDESEPAEPQGEQGAASPVPLMQVVRRYGEENSGPRVSSEGPGATDGASTAEDASEEAASEQDAADVTDATSPDEQVAITGQDAPSEGPEQGNQTLAGSLIPDNINAPSVDFGPSSPSRAGAGGEADDGKAGVLAAPAAKPASSLPTDALTTGKVKLTKAKKLYSKSDTNALVAMSAMGQTPPDIRGGVLCSSELQLQLWNTQQRFAVERVPQYKMPASGVQVVEDAFYTKGNWYKVYFRCEVDAKVTKITSFSFSVGDVIPRSEWTPKMIRAVGN